MYISIRVINYVFIYHFVYAFKVYQGRKHGGEFYKEPNQPVKLLQRRTSRRTFARLS